MPRQLFVQKSRRLVLPVHFLCLAPLLGCISPVAGDVKLEYDGVCSARYGKGAEIMGHRGGGIGSFWRRTITEPEDAERLQRQRVPFCMHKRQIF